MSIQPIITLMATLGIFLMFYSDKYVLLYRSARPKPSSSLINDSLNRILSLIVVVYSLGSLTWTSFLPTDEPTYAIVPNLISAGISVAFQFIPLGPIVRCLQKY